jgi:Linalool dehydratase/isomerase
MVWRADEHVNRDFVRAHYADQIGDFLRSGPDGALSVVAGERPLVMGQKIVGDSCDFGWTTAWASEMGDSDTLEGLLKHADAHMSPRWLNGGLYYPRNDVVADAEGNATMMEPMTGNVLLGYSRLNVPDGLWRFYNDRWEVSRFSEPALIRVASDLDVSKAWFNKDLNRLEFAMQRYDETVTDGTVVLGNLKARSNWILERDGSEIARGSGEYLEGVDDVDLDRDENGLVLRCLDPAPRSYVMTFRD